MIASCIPSSNINGRDSRDNTNLILNLVAGFPSLMARNACVVIDLPLSLSKQAREVSVQCRPVHSARVYL